MIPGSNLHPGGNDKVGGLRPIGNLYPIKTGLNGGGGSYLHDGGGSNF